MCQMSYVWWYSVVTGRLEFHDQYFVYFDTEIQWLHHNNICAGDIQWVVIYEQTLTIIKVVKYEQHQWERFWDSYSWDTTSWLASLIYPSCTQDPPLMSTGTPCLTTCPPLPPYPATSRCPAYPYPATHSVSNHYRNHLNQSEILKILILF